jgi:RTC4-like domain
MSRRQDRIDEEGVGSTHLSSDRLGHHSQTFAKSYTFPSRCPERAFSDTISAALQRPHPKPEGLQYGHDKERLLRALRRIYYVSCYPVINTIFLLTIPSTNFILLELRELLYRAGKKGLIVAYSIPDFVLYVLTPTMVLRLIIDDMSLDMIGAHQVMMDSARMGMFFYDDNIILS